jgi:hypothetical protein
MLPARDDDQFGDPYQDPLKQIDDDLRDEYGPEEFPFDETDPPTVSRWFAIMALIVVAAMILSTIWWIAIV